MLSILHSSIGRGSHERRLAHAEHLQGDLATRGSVRPPLDCSTSFRRQVVPFEAQRATAASSGNSLDDALRLAPAAGVSGRVVSESQFAFLEAEFPDEFAMAAWAERHALSDPGPAVIYARKALESGVKWVYRYDRSLPQPYEDQLNAYLNEPAFKALANGHVFNVAKKIQRAGNRAVHESKPPTKLEAVEVISALFQFCFWLAFTYGRESKPDPAVRFNPHKLTAARPRPRAASLAERQELEERLDRRPRRPSWPGGVLAELTRTVEQLEAERAALIAEVAAAKKAAEALPAEAHDWSEFETRQYKIDALLAEAGWRLRDVRDREFEVHGMPSASGSGYVDYVLWGDDGLPLGAGRGEEDDGVARRPGSSRPSSTPTVWSRRPGSGRSIFYSNGYEHWLWDDTQYPPRAVQGFLTKDELALLIQRRTTRSCRWPSLDIDNGDRRALRTRSGRSGRSPSTSRSTGSARRWS